MTIYLRSSVTNIIELLLEIVEEEKKLSHVQASWGMADCKIIKCWMKGMKIFHHQATLHHTNMGLSAFSLLIFRFSSRGLYFYLYVSYYLVTGYS